MKLDQLKDRFKLVELRNGKGETVYRIKKRFWKTPFWSYICGGDYPDEWKEPYEYDTKESAEFEIEEILDKELEKERVVVGEENLTKGLTGEDIVNCLKQASIKKKLGERNVV